MNLYEKLGVERDASPDKIKRSYRKRAAKVHPDVAPDKAEEFRELVVARDILLNPNHRAHYDRTGEIPKKDRPSQQTEAMVLIINLVTNIAAENNRRNILAKLREVLGNQKRQYTEAAKKCRETAAEIKDRWSDDAIRASIVESLEASAVMTEHAGKVAGEALALLKDSRYSFVEQPGWALGGWSVST